MKLLFRALWLGSIAAVCVLYGAIQKARIDRVAYVTRLAGGPDLERISPTARTSHWEESRALIIPEHNESSYHWLLQGQDAIRRRRLVVGTVDYDNAPVGRPVSAASLYRWWLTLLATVDHFVFRHDYAVSFERAALVADPLLLFLGVAGLVVLVLRSLGPIAAWVLALGAFSIFPFSSAFLPAAPDIRGLVALLVLTATVLLIAGLSRSCARWSDSGEHPRQMANGWFVTAGITSALLAWIHLTTGIALVGATIAGAFAARISSRPETWVNVGLPRAWRSWAIAGSATSVGVYFFDYLPRGGDFLRLDHLHPLYALAWAGAVELLVTQSWRELAANSPRLRRWVIALLASAPLVALIWILCGGTSPGPEKDLLWAKLTNLPEGPVAPNSWIWLKRDGASAMAWGTLLPLCFVPAVCWALWRAGSDAFNRVIVCVFFAAAAVFLVFAVRQLGAWSNLDAVLLAFAVFGVSGENSKRWIKRGVAGAAVVAASAVGLWLQRAREPVGPSMALTAAETTQLVERDLARWLGDRLDEKGITIFAPPRETTALCYFGGFKGIGTFAPENRAGFGAALSIVGAATMEEVEALVHARGIRCLVLPTWDPFLDDFARLYLSANYSNRSSLLVRELRNWNLPLWLRPMAYQMPAIPGFEKQSVLVFEVVDPQTPALAASRTAECLAELGDLPRARQISESLRRFPGDVGALAARVNVAMADGDTSTLEATAGVLKTRVQTHADRYLAWDRRVSLAVALAQTNALDLAKEQAERCLMEADEKKIRALSTGALYRLLVLVKTFELHFPEASLRALTERLLPADARAQL